VPPSGAPFLAITPATPGEFNAALDLMRANMGPYHERHGIPWDTDWLVANYRDKDNYSISRRGEWIGFVSLEWQPERAYIHTLQLTAAAQGRLFGMRVFEWILAAAAARGLPGVACRSFRDNPAVALYRKLGFQLTAEEGLFCLLERKL